jgi:hypothetical protein
VRNDLEPERFGDSPHQRLRFDIVVGDEKRWDFNRSWLGGHSRFRVGRSLSRLRRDQGARIDRAQIGRPGLTRRAGWPPDRSGGALTFRWTGAQPVSGMPLTTTSPATPGYSCHFSPLATVPAWPFTNAQAPFSLASAAPGPYHRNWQGARSGRLLRSARRAPLRSCHAAEGRRS